MVYRKTLSVLVGLGITGLLLLAGCEKEQESAAPAVPDLTGAAKKVVKEADTKVPAIKKMVEEKTPDIETLVEEKAPEVEKVVVQAKTVVTDLKTEATQSLSDIKEQVQAMSMEDLMARALKYKDAIMGHEGEVNSLMAKVKALPATAMLGDEAKQFKADIAQLTEAIKPLKERYDIYIGKLTELKADISSLGLK